MQAHLRASGGIRPASFVFLDIETTGLHPDRGARITEVAVLDDSGVRFATEVDAGDDALLSTKMPYLLNQLRAGVVVGHNVQFDLRFIAYEADRLGHDGPDLYFIDTLGLARNVLPRQSDHRLEATLDAFHITPQGDLHTAITDARAVRTLFWRLLAHGDFPTLADAGLKPLKWTAF